MSEAEEKSIAIDECEVVISETVLRIAIQQGWSDGVVICAMFRTIRKILMHYTPGAALEVAERWHQAIKKEMTERIV